MPGEVNIALNQIAQYNPVLFQTIMNSAGLKDVFSLQAEDTNNGTYTAAQLPDSQQHANLNISSTMLMPSYPLNMSNGGNGSLNQSLELDPALNNNLNLSNNLNINNVLYDNEH